MSRNTLIVGATLVVIVALGVWAYSATRPKPIIQIEAGGTSVSIGNDGVSVTVDKPASN